MMVGPDHPMFRDRFGNGNGNGGGGVGGMGGDDMRSGIGGLGEGMRGGNNGIGGNGNAYAGRVPGARWDPIGPGVSSSICFPLHLLSLPLRSVGLAPFPLCPLARTCDRLSDTCMLGGGARWTLEDWERLDRIEPDSEEWEE